ncbi:DUF2069 domain-containing protein [Reinekea blandensis]|uniref:Uncharacterized protein n=1 Tax=Reinekea blandensis MED297 TaxID=314283 RepID=A4BFF6_9GAMM|nr:DUF2069 domain-containing protein [Reinekea blandensis]EAR09051.1 hypothetical protein MED297_16953 [Reinekea sp. MED297] [Reinekea blandensis MED297]
MKQKRVNINTRLKWHFFLLIMACILGTFLSGPSPAGTDLSLPEWFGTGLMMSLITVLPLMFFIPTVLKPTPGSVSWLSFFLLAYLVFAILKIFSPGGFFGGTLMTLFNLTAFFYAVAWLRPFKKAAKEKQKS